MRAAVYDDGFEVVDLDVREPAAGEVAVAIDAAGLCKSDVSVVTGAVPYPTPVVLGHEASGVIDAVGPDVPSDLIGRQVVVTALASCGCCDHCQGGRPTLCRASAASPRAPFTLDGSAVYQFSNVGAFAERTVVSRSQAVVVDDVEPVGAAVLGCAVLTGAGAAMCHDRVVSGSTVLVTGAGGIGLNVIQGARLAGAGRIIVCDSNPRKMDLAVVMGATEVHVTSTGDEVLAVVDAACPGGVDVAFECTGVPAVLRATVEAVRWGGTTVMLGLPPVGVDIAIAPRSIYHDKQLVGSRLGSGDPARLIPEFVRRYRAGELMLTELVTDVVPLEGVGDLVDRLLAGELDRGVVVPSS